MNSDRDAEILGDRFDSLKQNRFFNSKIELRPVPLELEDVYNKFKE
jgi:hypothetical protein